MVMRNPSPRHLKHWSLAILATMAFTGCGTSAYEDRHSATLKYLQLETPFRPLWEKPVEDFPSQTLSLRIPKIFRTGEANSLNPMTMLTPDPRNEKDVVDSYRVQPPFLKLPGHQRTYEGFTQVRGTQSLDMITKPYYLYIAMIESNAKDKKPLSPQEMEKQIRDKLVKQFGNKDVSQWEKVEPRTPDGGTMTWKRIAATGEQYWVTYEDKAARYKIYPGVYTLYLNSTNDRHILLGWRCAKEVAEAIRLEEIAPICAGTVKLK